ncbi:MAG: glucose-1-phosphate adenylyltransferase [Anaerolineales bacterium]|nr:glucose-1-phosphate adenylyltransferase [Anaerolineales bacterium]
MAAIPKTMALIMAGGASPALSALTELRAEAALPFAGKYRIIDFSLSNCINSGIYNVGVLTQYQPRSLNDHVANGRPWDLDRSQGGLRLLQPYLSSPHEASAWQEGTADAVRFHLDVVEESNPEVVLILAGDHIYKMDYGPMLAFHVESKADVTIAVRSVSPFETHRYGMIAADRDGRVTRFEEKPRRTRSTLASMGIYVFSRDALMSWLGKEGKNQRDFGREVIPTMLSAGKKVYSHKVTTYWADVGTLQAFWEANMALLAETPALDLYDLEWVVHTRSEERPPVLLGDRAKADGNLMSDGCRIDGEVIRSVLSPGVVVEADAVVQDSVIFGDTVIRKGAKVDRTIIDQEVIVGENARVGAGDDNTPNHEAPSRLNTGLTVIGQRVEIPAETVIGRNVVIHANVKPRKIGQKEIPSGATV